MLEDAGVVAAVNGVIVDIAVDNIFDVVVGAIVGGVYPMPDDIDRHRRAKKEAEL